MRDRWLIDRTEDIDRRERLTSTLGTLCDERLPEAAQSSDDSWPVHLDHCFRRLVYDHAVRDKWSDHIDSPFIDNATVPRLRSAVLAGKVAYLSGPGFAWRLQEQSMLWRGEMDGDDAEYVDPAKVPNHP